MKHLFSFLLVNFALFHCGFAQLPAKFQIRQYTTENGMPSNGITSIQWDEETGFLWMSTQAGVVRFNGIDFKTYSNRNTAFIATERIWGLFRDFKGVIYAIDDVRNILKIQKNKLSFNLRGTEEKPLPFYAYLSSEAFFNKEITHQVSGTLPDPTLRNIVPTSDSSIIFITDQKAYSISIQENQSIPLPIGSVLLKNCFKIDNKVFFVSTENKMFFWNPADQTLTSIKFNLTEEFKNSDLRIFWQNGTINPIVVNKNRAWILNYINNCIDAREICNVVPTDFKFNNLQYSVDKKLLFLSSESKGLSVISENGVDVLKPEKTNLAATTAYYSQIELPDSSILTNETHIIGPHKQNPNSFPVKEQFFFNNYVTSDSVLWFLKNEPNIGAYLNSYNYKTLEVDSYKKVITPGRFGLVYSNNNVYVAANNGLGILEGDSLNYLFRTPDKDVYNFNVFNMVEISPGNLGVATCDGLINYNLAAKKVDTLLRFQEACIRTLWKFKDYLFIGTYGRGYYIYKNGQMKAMPMDKNGFLSHVHCFVPDKYGYCWMSTNRGLFKASLADILNAYETNGEKIYYHYFGRNDGMENTEMNGGCTPCALQLKSGIISFPSMDGLVWVDPATSHPILPTGDIFIDELYADNKKIDLDSAADLQIPANVNAVTVYLGYPAWCKKENLYIEYDLNNTGEWKRVDLMNNSVIHLFGINSGKYDLRIRKMKGFGENNYSYDELKFTVKTPWYLQWWAFLLMAAIAYAVGRFFVQLRIKQYRIRQERLEKLIAEKTGELKLKNEILEKNDTIKTRLISIISHDIVTPLKFLSVAGKNLLEKRELMSEELQNETISEMTNTSQDLQLLSTNILNWIKYQNENRRLAKENFNVHELVNQVIGVLKSMAHQKGLHIFNRVDESLEIFQFAEPLRILIYNLVSNAINFSETGNIVINNEQQPGLLIISVEDEGIGMSPEQVSNIMAEQIVITARKTDSRQGNGLGYLIIKDLVKMIGGELKISSEKGTGTTVEVYIPNIAGEARPSV